MIGSLKVRASIKPAEGYRRAASENSRLFENHRSTDAFGPSFVPENRGFLAMSELASCSQLSGKTRASTPVSIHGYRGQLVKRFRATTLNCGLARNGPMTSSLALQNISRILHRPLADACYFCCLWQSYLGDRVGKWGKTIKDCRKIDCWYPGSDAV